MAWFQRRNRIRRIPADRSRPRARERISLNVAPRGKRVSRLVMIVLFLAGGVVILNFPRIGVHLRVGEIAKRDYRARVKFFVPDDEATRRAANEAEERAAKVFRANADHLQDIPARLETHLTSIVEAKSPEGLDAWGLSPKGWSSLKKGINKRWIQTVAAPVQAALKSVGDAGIMDGSDLQQVQKVAPGEITLYSGSDKRETERRNATRIMGYPAELRDFLTRQLADLLKGQNSDVKEAFLKMLTHAAKPTLTLDPVATEEARLAARKQVPTQYTAKTKGSIILRQGERATRGAIHEIELEAEKFKAHGGVANDKERRAEWLLRRILRGGGVTALFLLGYVLLAYYASRFASDVLASNTRVFGLLTVSLVALGAVRALEHFGLSLHWTPIVLAVMLLDVATGPTLALGTSGLLAIMAGIVTDGGMALTVPLFVGGLVAVFRLVHLRRRTDLLKAGVIAGIVQALVVWTLYLAGLRGEGPPAPGPWPIHESLAGLGSGLLAGSILTGVLPYVEKFFDVATEFRLLEWTDQNQPLLRKLALDAPGTYHHSSVVSNLAEAAAEQIGANALLARAGGYLHDVGKLYRPEYFIENSMGMPSLHDHLSPMLSTLILTAHTRDGVEIARHYGVPSPLRRIIAEHHGTLVVQYFYDKALKEAGKHATDIKESAFRYRGPKPGSPESAVVMLADAVESAARSLDKASPSRIEKLVHDIVEERLKDGQFDNSRMHITDIRKVERSLVRGLTAISHPRIRYPST